MSLFARGENRGENGENKDILNFRKELSINVEYRNVGMVGNLHRSGNT